MDKKTVKILAAKRDAVISDLLEKLEGKVKAAQRGLLKTVIEDFVDGLEKDAAGNIANTIGNKRRFTMFDTIYNRYAKDSGLEVIKTIAEGVGTVINFNQQYYSALTEPAKLAPIQSQVKETLGAWLGLTERGAVAENGYLDTLLKDATVKNGIKNMVLKSVISQGGYNDLKKTLAVHIEGNKEQTGALQRYYRNFAYDTYSVADRTAGKITADKLKFNYAIYEGGLIEASRDFCKEHNGNVYSREEIADFMPEKAIPPNYDPFTDLGGYGCRHHLNWVPDAVAFALRPELKNDKPKIAAPKEESAKLKAQREKVEELNRKYSAGEFVPTGTLLRERAKLAKMQKAEGITPGEPTPPKAVKAPPVKPVTPKPAPRKEEPKPEKPIEVKPPVKAEPTATPSTSKKVENPYKKFANIGEGERVVKDVFSKTWGLDIGNVKVADGVSAAQLNRNVKQLAALSTEYEIFKDYQAPGGVKIVFESTGKSYGAVTTSLDGKKLIEANFGSKISPYSLREYIENPSSLRPFSRVDRDKNDLATATHEFAHVITLGDHGSSATDSRAAQFWAELKQIRAQYTKELTSIPASRIAKINEIHLGQYASTNENEFFAEAFTEYKLSSKPSKYAKKVGKIVDLYFKRK
jgi:hypothetical protein